MVPHRANHHKFTLNFTLSSRSKIWGSWKIPYLTQKLVNDTFGHIWTEHIRNFQTKRENSPDFAKFIRLTQSAFTYWKLTKETLEHGVKYVQS